MWIVDGQFCFHFLYDHYMVMTMKMIMMMMVGGQDDDDEFDDDDGNALI